MPRLDRLSSLITHFEIKVLQKTTKGPNLIIAGHGEQLEALYLFLKKQPEQEEIINCVGALSLDLSGKDNPLMDALPDLIKIDLQEQDSSRSIANLIIQEMKTPRCGSQFALDKLCELLLLKLLRSHIEQHTERPGLFAGLAHKKLSSVMVAIHNDPGHHWQIDDFLKLAGMSRSHFMAEFQTIIGKTPMAYLKQWRMILARIAIVKGERVNSVARKLGYGSPDAFSRAFMSVYGMSPTKLKQNRL